MPLYMPIHGTGPADWQDHIGPFAESMSSRRISIRPHYTAFLTKKKHGFHWSSMGKETIMLCRAGLFGGHPWEVFPVFMSL
ncbi:hypothetical protein B6259_07020 [Ruminococcaceae bacterium CPB6]|jgi:hypothetical protein|nr:hypothetical protein B6259_07020 [Ruminococcaceae bacterium CPB6]